MPRIAWLSQVSLSPPPPSCLLIACLYDYYTHTSPPVLWCLLCSFSPDMAKRVANLLRVVLSLQHAPDATSDSTPDPQRVPLRLLAPHIGRLPMPEDYALEELRSLTQSYLRELTVGSQ